MSYLLRFLVVASQVSIVSCASAESTYTSTNNSNRVLVIQSGPNAEKPVVSVEQGPGYTIIRQNSRHNKSIVIQVGPKK